MQTTTAYSTGRRRFLLAVMAFAVGAAAAPGRSKAGRHKRGNRHTDREPATRPTSWAAAATALAVGNEHLHWE